MASSFSRIAPSGTLGENGTARSASYRQATLHNARFSRHAIDARLATFQIGYEQNLVTRWLRPIGVLRPVVRTFHDDVEQGVFDLVIGCLISGEALGEALLYLRVCASSYRVSAQVISTEKRITLVEAPFLTNMKIGTSTHALKEAFRYFDF